MANFFMEAPRWLKTRLRQSKFRIKGKKGGQEKKSKSVSWGAITREIQESINKNATKTTGSATRAEKPRRAGRTT